MSRPEPPRVAILFLGNKDDRQTATGETSRFSNLFSAFAAEGVRIEPAVYHDDFCADVRQQLLQCDAVLVWVNPIEGGRDRSVLDGMLREVARAGVFVSTHPDVILQLGTKEVLFRTREMGWGCDTHLYRSADQLRGELPLRLATGKPRVLKQNRGNGGNGVWRVQRESSAAAPGHDSGDTTLDLQSVISVRHAIRGAEDERMTIEVFCERCEGYFGAVDGLMIDQEYQERLPEGMLRCYLVHDRVAGFGHQAINALIPAPPGAMPHEVPQAGPRLYHPPSKPEFQGVKRQLQVEWIPALCRLLNIARESLPVLWDCDFLLGPKDTRGEDTYVLCEVNVSSVAPYPESAVPYIVEATLARIRDPTRRPR